MSKYKAIKTTIDNIVFDSKKEAKRYGELMLRFRAGQIRNLELQPEFRVELNGVKVFKYRADFAYFEGQDRIFEDVKGVRTPVYKLKKRIVEVLYSIQIRET